MPTSYTSLIGLALPVTGELAGVWGDTVNNYITNYLDSAVAGTQTISGSQTAVTLSVTNGSSLVTAGSGATGSAQFQIINCTGNPAGLLTITAPASSRQYIIINATSTSQSVKIVGTGPTTGVTLISGEKAHVAWNGSDFVKIATTAAAGGSNTQVQYNSSGVLAGSSNLTFDGTNLTVGGTASATKLIPTGGAITGNGMYLPAANSVAITTNGAQAIYIDSSQNVGVGVTPSAWYVGSGTSKAIQFNASSALYDFSASGNRQTQLLNNAYLNTSANFIYLNTDAASRYMQNAGIHSWYNATSGTAGNIISFTQAMTLDASGNLGLGVTPSAWVGAKALSIANAGSVYADGVTYGWKTGLAANCYRTGNAPWAYQNSGVRATRIESDETNPFAVHIAGTGTAGNTISFTQAMTLDASGNFYVGTTSQSGGSNITFNQPANADMKIAASVSTGTRAAYQVFVNTTVTTVGTENSTGGSLATGTSAYATVLANSGAYPISFATNNTERMRLDSSGNLGLGVTPSAWDSSVLTALQVRSGSISSVPGGGNDTYVASNAYYNVSWKYIAAASAPATYYRQANGAHSWNTAASGTAGNTISFTQAMTLDSSGNLGLGTTSITNCRFQIKGANNTTNAYADGLKVTSNNETVEVQYSWAGINANDTLRIATGGTERARITSGGDFYLGATSSGTTAKFYVTQTTASGYTQVVNALNNGGTRYLVLWQADGTSVGSVTSNGTTTAYNTSSDYRLKENIQPMTGALERLAALKPCTYTWKSDKSFGEGFIAHEVAEVYPQAVSGEKDAVEDDGSIKAQGVDYGKLTPLLTAALQEAMKEIEALKARIAALEAA